MRSVDLNCDCGEGFGAYRIGDDNAMLDIVTSVNVACGFHAGDPEIMATTFKAAKAKGVAVGAHPGFPDLWGFGRRKLPFTAGEIERLVVYQIGAANALATYAGARLAYVKIHGALSNIAAEDETIAQAIARTVKSGRASPRLSRSRRNEIGNGGLCAGTCGRPRNLRRSRLYGRRPSILPLTVRILVPCTLLKQATPEPSLLAFCRRSQQ
jgi:lactam utilization protein B